MVKPVFFLSLTITLTGITISGVHSTLYVYAQDHIFSLLVSWYSWLRCSLLGLKSCNKHGIGATKDK